METAVIIARFQTPYLHQGHLHLIKKIKEKHKKIIIILGVSGVLHTKKNPYDVITREGMIKKAFPDAIVLPLPDHPDDYQWSINLDELLMNTFPLDVFLLYGSRDSFIPYYSGNLATYELPAHGEYNATEIRQHYANKVDDSKSFRSGILYAVYNQFTKVQSTVDVALFRHGKSEILLGMKNFNRKWRLIGGFVDVEDSNLEVAAKRELFEEAGNLEIGPMTYELSCHVDDWRYKNEEDKIITVVYSCDYISGTPEAKDDITDVAWTKVKDLPAMLKNGDLTEEHSPLFQFLIKKYN